jgi:OmpA-OmpF porin, OOP family
MTRLTAPWYHPNAATAAALALAALLCVAPAASAQTATMPSAAAPAGSAVAVPRTVLRSTRLPARGIFEGDKLSRAAQDQLAALLLDADDLDVEAVFVAPSGPWQTEGTGERSLTPARLQAVRDFLASRGAPGRRIYVESRIDPKAPEALLEVEVVGRPAP